MSKSKIKKGNVEPADQSISSSNKKRYNAAKRVAVSTHTSTISLPKNKAGKYMRPKGQAGRSDGGFSMQATIGLDGQNAKWNSIRLRTQDLVNTMLDQTKTKRQQSELKIGLFLAEAARTIKYLNMFENAWPARDIMMQYLTNRIAWRRKLKEDASDGEEQGSDVEGEDLQGEDVDASDAGPDDIPDEATTKHIVVKTRSAAAPKKSNGKLPLLKPENLSSKRPARAVCSTGKRPKKQVKTEIPKEDEAEESTTPGSEPDAPPPLPPARPRPRPVCKITEKVPLTADDVWGRCPGCDMEEIPLDPSPRLLALFEKRRDMLTAKAEHTDVSRMDAAICSQVKSDRVYALCLRRMQSRGWPLKPDWAHIPERVMAMEAELREIVEDGRARQKCVAWQTVEGFGMVAKMSKLATDPRLQERVFPVTRPGYYGEKGAAIIASTLLRIFPVDEAIAHQIRPWSVDAFTRIILIPTVACRLIREDLDENCDEGGWERMEASAECGVLLHPEDDNDEELDLIFKANIRAGKQPQKAVKSSDNKPGKRIITLEDYGEPEPPARKTRRTTRQASKSAEDSEAVAHGSEPGRGRPRMKDTSRRH